MTPQLPTLPEAGENRQFNVTVLHAGSIKMLNYMCRRKTGHEQMEALLQMRERVKNSPYWNENFRSEAMDKVERALMG